MATHREIEFVKVPDGMPTEDCFRVVEAPMPEPGEGEVLVRTHYLSIDPYFRNAMAGSNRYGKLVPGVTMIGRGAGVVIVSRHPAFEPGDAVQSEFGWREHVVLAGDGLRKLAPDLQPLSLSLGVVGQSGATAFVGLYDIANIKAGDTVVVSAAAGAVGSAVGQIARIEGCRVVGIAGGPEKCRHVVEDLGFDACVDYKAGPIGPALAEAVPEGVDIYFDNVGGTILEDVLDLCNDFARIAVCGQISQYNSAEPMGLRNINLVLPKALKIQGLQIGANLSRRDEALEVLLGWWREGKLRYRETVADGFEEAPRAFINMLSGGNYGKQVVKVV
jgi:NADPH-dependent curcumin reductase